jgi:signal transduction histidine kinase
MDSYYAPAERKDGDDLLSEIVLASQNPVIDTLLKSVRGLLAILNEDRQILAVNDEFLKMLGIESAGELLGLRPGEVIGCEHAKEMPGGCGTSRFCSNCGAAIAIVAALAGEKPEERDCIVTININGKQADLYLRIKAYPFELRKRKFVFLFLQDITAQRKRVVAERVHFHDVENIIFALQQTLEKFEYENRLNVNKFVNHIETLISKLRKEVEIQKVISETELGEPKNALRGVSVSRIFQELKALFSSHDVAKGKYVNIPEYIPDQIINTDLVLLVRILANMLTNALEATKWGGEVKLWLEQTEKTITFCVWNKEVILKNTARKIFKRHFTKKKEAGRGFGTYSMKLFAERYLKGKVNFTTSKSAGTVFRLVLSKELHDMQARKGADKDKVR